MGCIFHSFRCIVLEVQFGLKMNLGRWRWDVWLPSNQVTHLGCIMGMHHIESNCKFFGLFQITWCTCFKGFHQCFEVYARMPHFCCLCFLPLRDDIFGGYWIIIGMYFPCSGPGPSWETTREPEADEPKQDRQSCGSFQSVTPNGMVVPRRHQ